VDWLPGPSKPRWQPLAVTTCWSPAVPGTTRQTKRLRLHSGFFARTSSGKNARGRSIVTFVHGRRATCFYVGNRQTRGASVLGVSDGPNRQRLRVITGNGGIMLSIVSQFGAFKAGNVMVECCARQTLSIKREYSTSLTTAVHSPVTAPMGGPLGEFEEAVPRSCPVTFVKECPSHLPPVMLL